MKSEATSQTSRLRHLAQCATFVLIDYRPQATGLEWEHTLPSCLCVIRAHVFYFYLHSFVVMLLIEASVKESGGIKKDQIYPLSTATHDAPWSFLFSMSTS